MFSINLFNAIWLVLAIYIFISFFVSFHAHTKRSCNDKSFFIWSSFFFWWMNLSKHFIFSIFLQRKKCALLSCAGNEKPYSGWIQFFFFFLVSFCEFHHAFAPNRFSDRKWINFPDKNAIVEAIFDGMLFSTRKKMSSAGDAMCLVRLKRFSYNFPRKSLIIVLSLFAWVFFFFSC